MQHPYSEEHNQYPEPSRHVALQWFNTMDWELPTWAWEPMFEGQPHGAVPLGSLSIWAGRPGVGKSTSGRWFAAQVTNGQLPGCWYGTPHKVAYIAGEESLKHNVLPSMIAAGADMTRVCHPEVTFTPADGISEVVSFVPERDMKALTRFLIDSGVKVVIVDPLMEYMGGGNIDIYKNDQVRAKVKPWAKLAEDIDGVVIAIMHLNKSANGDVVAGINGSSAFGEVARSVFGFAKDSDGERVMSLEKNSIGVEGAAWTYRIDSKEVANNKGDKGEVAAFSFVGDSSRTVGEVLRDAATPRQDGDNHEAESVVVDYLISQGGSAPANDIRKQVMAAGLTWKTVQNNRKKWGVETQKKESGWVWTLESRTGQHPDSRSRTCGAGTLGPSQVRAQKQGPKKGKVPHPAYKGTSRDLAAEGAEGTHIRTRESSREPSALSDNGTYVLGLLSDAYPMSPQIITGSIPAKERNARKITDVQPHLDHLVAAGLVALDNKGRYTRKENAA